MPLAFDLQSVTVTEFGVGRDEEEAQAFTLVPVDATVQAALQEMVSDTWDRMTELSDDPPAYEPSEKHAGSEYLVAPVDDDLATSLRRLHRAANPPTMAAALADPKDVFCYFTRMTDSQGRRLTAVRRATQFKGVLKSQLMWFVTDTFRIIEDDVFRLDSDFDLLIDDTTVHILRPAGFEFVGQLQEAVLAAAPTNVKAIRKDLAFIDFTGIEDYAGKHPRAARALASIAAQKATKDINKSALKALCKRTGVEIKESKGRIIVEKAQVIGFLEVLDRRRYQLELVKGTPESFRAGSRQKLPT
jgi:Kiwa protein KwaB-like